MCVYLTPVATRVQGCEYCGIGGKEASGRGRFLSNNRRKEARDWMDKFEFVVDRTGFYYEELQRNYNGVILLRWIDGAEKLVVARKFYYDQMLDAHEDGKLDPAFTKFSWVDVPNPFDLTDFCWRLLLDFHSDDPEAKQITAIGMMEGSQDPIERCLELLRQDTCFVVIDGLLSMHDWDQIKKALLFETSGLIMVITKEKFEHLAGEQSVYLGDRVRFIDAPDYLRNPPASQPLIKVCSLS